MSAVILFEFSPDASTRTQILRSIVLPAIKGAAELLFVGHAQSEAKDRELIAVRLSSCEQADAVIRACRLQSFFPSTIDVRLIRLEPIDPVDSATMLFP